MSLESVKKIADLKEQISICLDKRAAKNDEIRSSMNDELVKSFEEYMAANGFDVTATAGSGRKATYKDVVVELRLAGKDDNYMGTYHSFDIIYKGQENFIRIIPDIPSPPGEAFPQGTEIEKLQKNLASLEEQLKNYDVKSYDFEIIVKKSGRQPAARIAKKTMQEVIDHILG